MDRIFKRSLSKQLNKWLYATFPEKRLEKLQNTMSAVSPSDYNYAARVGSLDLISKMNEQIAYRAKVRAFRMLAQNMFNMRSDVEQTDNLN